MKIEIQVSGKWVPLAVFDGEILPTVRVAEDAGTMWFQTLLSLNGKIASIKIDGIEGRYGVEFDGSLHLKEDSIGFCYLSLAKAVQLPPDCVVTLVDA